MLYAWYPNRLDLGTKYLKKQKNVFGNENIQNHILIVEIKYIIK